MAAAAALAALAGALVKPHSLQPEGAVPSFWSNESRASAAEPAVLGVVFPGYHQDELNDMVWGKGYTEWWRINDGEVLLAGQHQPQEPLQRYDLSEPEALAYMAATAKKHGIDALLMYHYWFQEAPTTVPGLMTKRVLRGPMDTLLAHPEIDAPFALAWADFEMSKKAQGFAVKGAKESELKWGDTFMPVTHTLADDVEHATWLVTHAFNDPRYLKVDGKPLFAIFAPPSIEGYRAEFLRTLRRVTRELSGQELYLIDFVKDTLSGDAKYRMAKGRRSADDFDSLLLFSGGFQTYTEKELLNERCYATNGTALEAADGSAGVKAQVPCTVVDYARLAEASVWRADEAFGVWAMQHAKDSSADSASFDTRFDVPVPSAMPGWDNTARYPHGGPSLTVAMGNTPELFGDWLTKLMRQGESIRPKFVAVNAINEWGEGCHLEPDTRDGMRYYKALQKVKRGLPFKKPVKKATK